VGSFASWVGVAVWVVAKRCGCQSQARGMTANVRQGHSVPKYLILGFFSILILTTYFIKKLFLFLTLM
jgi:hypothetical protein